MRFCLRTLIADRTIQYRILSAKALKTSTLTQKQTVTNSSCFIYTAAVNSQLEATEKDSDLSIVKCMGWHFMDSAGARSLSWSIGLYGNGTTRMKFWRRLVRLPQAPLVEIPSKDWRNNTKLMGHNTSGHFAAVARSWNHLMTGYRAALWRIAAMQWHFSPPACTRVKKAVIIRWCPRIDEGCETTLLEE